MNNTLTTVLIPLRVDSVERLENLLCVIKYLIKLDLYIFIYEADTQEGLDSVKNALYRYMEQHHSDRCRREYDSCCL